MNKIEFYKETNFKETPIGKIPNDWQIQKLGNIITFIKGKKPKEMTEQCEEGRLPYLSAEYLRENKATNFVKPSNDVILVNDGDLILLWDGSNAGEFFYGKRGVLSSTMVKIEQKEQVFDQKFLFYILKMKEDFLKGQTKGTGIPHVDEDVLKNIILPNPSLSEQRIIAGVLSVVDLAIQRTDMVIAKTERLKKGLMQTLLTKGIGHKEFKDTEIGKIPKTWQIVSLGDVCEQRNEIVHPSTNNREPFVGLEHIAPGETRLHNYAQSADVRSAKFRFYAGDILYGKLRPYLDKAVIVDFNGICSTDLLVLTLKENVLKEFLIYVLHSNNFVEYAIATMRGTNHPRTSWSAISKFKFGLPERSEQQKIAEILSAADMKIEFEKKEKVRLELIKQGLMDLLLTGKIRVKVI
ncbi:MAG: restriction endonuclease subunit S [Candidatus Bathyarchaeia archaeon]